MLLAPQYTRQTGRIDAPTAKRQAARVVVHRGDVHARRADHQLLGLCAYECLHLRHDPPQHDVSRSGNGDHLRIRGHTLQRKRVGRIASPTDPLTNASAGERIEPDWFGLVPGRLAEFFPDILRFGRARSAVVVPVDARRLHHLAQHFLLRICRLHLRIDHPLS